MRRNRGGEAGSDLRGMGLMEEQPPGAFTPGCGAPDPEHHTAVAGSQHRPCFCHYNVSEHRNCILHNMMHQLGSLHSLRNGIGPQGVNAFGCWICNWINSCNKLLRRGANGVRVCVACVVVSRMRGVHGMREGREKRQIFLEIGWKPNWLK